MSTRKNDDQGVKRIPFIDWMQFFPFIFLLLIFIVLSSGEIIMLITMSLLLILAQAGLFSGLCFEEKQVRISCRDGRALPDIGDC